MARAAWTLCISVACGGSLERVGATSDSSADALPPTSDAGAEAGPICEPRAIASGGDPYAFVSRPVLDEEWVYWVEANGPSGTGYRVPKTGGPKEQLFVADTYDVLVDDPYIDWADCSGAVIRATKDGSDPEKLITNVICPRSLIADAANFYFTSLTDATSGIWQIQRAKKDGTGLTTVVVEDAEWLTEDDGNLYYARPELAGGDVRRVPKSNGAPTTVLTVDPSQHRINGLAVDGGFLYVAEAPPSEPNAPPTLLVRLPLAGGPPETVMSFPWQPNQPGLLGVVAGTVFFTSGRGTGPKPLPGPTMMARTPDGRTTSLGSANSTLGVAVDAANVFWTTSSRSLLGDDPPTTWRACRP